ncbi:hypothetical protein ABL78_6716 [Leptomonas seymouri]|uniref:Actin-like protein n=1 Tax=Leptomonas seymouri TaxID=5684 RepID=A0A0N1I2Y9_LEPSE|nr:hypothetical protein ABL78_6716 [Leptomonas seymouri]|eukprot:KPI84230.1 hypothetical protein ABL78_6716 [Leptomonas seymouri]
MDLKLTCCFLDIGPATTTVTTSSETEVHKWQLETPVGVKAALTRTPTCPAVEHGAAVVDAFLHRLAKSAQLATAGHIVLLARTHSVHDYFYLYVLRWLHTACPSSTPVSVMPLPLYAARLAGLASVLVVESNEGVVTCTPVLEDLVAPDVAAQWGDVRAATASAELRSLSQCWWHVSREIMSSVLATTRLPDNGEKDDNSGSTPALHLNACAPKSGVEQRLMDGIPFVCEMEQHFQLCRRRGLDACLSTVLLYGDVATVVEARYCMGLLLSMFLPDSVVTWC